MSFCSFHKKRSYVKHKKESCWLWMWFSHNFSQNKRNRPWFLITQIHHIELLMKSQLHLCTLTNVFMKKSLFWTWNEAKSFHFKSPVRFDSFCNSSSEPQTKDSSHAYNNWQSFVPLFITIYVWIGSTQWLFLKCRFQSGFCVSFKH